MDIDTIARMATEKYGYPWIEIGYSYKIVECLCDKLTEDETPADASQFLDPDSELPSGNLTVILPLELGDEVQSRLLICDKSQVATNLRKLFSVSIAKALNRIVTNQTVCLRLARISPEVEDYLDLAPLELRRQIEADLKHLVVNGVSSNNVSATMRIVIEGTKPAGRGGFGEVWRAVQTSRETPDTSNAATSDQRVAVKVLFPGIGGTAAIIKSLRKEAQAWGKADDRTVTANIVPFIGVMSSRDIQGLSCAPAPAMVSKWMPNGSVTAYVAAHPGVSVYWLCREVLDGLEYLAESDIVHGDLKGENILIDESGRACLADFGLATVTHNHATQSPTSNSSPTSHLSSTPTSQTEADLASSYSSSTSDTSTINATSIAAIATSSGMGGSIPWMSPERFVPEQFGLSSTRCTPAGDMYAFGIVAWEISHKKQPFWECKTQPEMVLKIVSGARPAISADIPIEPESPLTFWADVERCWGAQPTLRPDAVTLRGEWVNSPKATTVIE